MTYTSISVLILLYMCIRTSIYVSSYDYICVLILLYVSSYYYICVLRLPTHYVSSHICWPIYAHRGFDKLLSMRPLTYAER
jgi:uncharacterized membrane protein (GlpM family)